MFLIANFAAGSDAYIFPKPHTLYVFKEIVKKNKLKKPQNPPKDLVIEVHIFLNTFIILQKVLKTLVY